MLCTAQKRVLHSQQGWGLVQFPLEAFGWKHYTHVAGARIWRNKQARVQVELSLKQPSETAFLTLYRHRIDHCIPFCCFFRKPSISNLTNVFIYSHSFWNETNRQKAKRQQQHCQIYARDKATAIWISDSSLTCIKLVCIVSFSL